MKKITLSILLSLTMSSSFIFSQIKESRVDILNKSLELGWTLSKTPATWKLRSSRFHKQEGLMYYYFDLYYNDILVKGTESKQIVNKKEVLVHSNLFDIKRIKQIPEEFSFKGSIEDLVYKAARSISIKPEQLQIHTLSLELNKEKLEVSGKDVSGFSLKAIWFMDQHGKLIPAYSFIFDLKKKKQKWNVVISADGENTILYKRNKVISCKFEYDPVQTEYCKTFDSGLPNNSLSIVTLNSPQAYSARYKVFELGIESPYFGVQTIVKDPWKKNLNASPYGWHSSFDSDIPEFFKTQGNNVYCLADFTGDGQNLYEINQGNSLDFLYNYTPDVNFDINKDASLTQLFYAANMMHDIIYNYGFDEQAGNFQENNSGNGGEEGDPLDVIAMSGSEVFNLGNAFFTPIADGTSPFINMGTFSRKAILSLTFTQGANTLVFDTLIQATNLKDLKSFEITGELILVRDELGGQNFCDNNIDLTFSNPANKIPFIPAIDSFGNFKCFDDETILKFQNSNAKGVVLYYKGDPEYKFLYEIKIDPINIPYAALMNVSDSKKVEDLLSKGKVTVKFTINPSYNIPFDAAFENSIFVHEFGHGISTRGTDPTSEECLINSEAPSEGWSDWYSLVITHNFSTQKRNSSRPLGNYVLGQTLTGQGVRTHPYSTDLSVNPLTYKDLRTEKESHDIGEIWCVTLWDLYWNLVDHYGYDPDLYNGHGGNNIALKLVTEGLKLQPCSPGFIDCRDAILLADSIFFNSKNRCFIWLAFAKRGMGIDADQGSPEITGDETPSFKLPPDCIVNTQNYKESANDFSIVPNPNNGSFKILCKEERQELVDIVIQSMDGNMIKVDSKLLLLNEYVVSDLPAGVYIVQIRSGHFNAAKRMIVMR